MGTFPTRILLATDGSPDAERAGRVAVDLANGTGSELHVVTVARGLDPAYFVHEYYYGFQEALEAFEEEARQVLEEQVRKLKEYGGRVARAHLLTEQPKDRAIVRLSEELDAGLIVLGSRGRGGLRRALMGSVSDSVVRHAHRPVLIVRR
ncbi:hypothetical protein RxyAA322_22320 [Rubrobacter xylanophilus]|uniref:UspA domain-containing protein n=1 Tax=Rubrobacter xylanophilus TaxID=49319 RepID=A0A510HKH4_9ACTN|nr:universal stress protein [Rubrobacter xylanophilus]BBL80378.1 hypothetical protein RxyAA322_22320 [Rubrobacter xylanophilus]